MEEKLYLVQQMNATLLAVAEKIQYKSNQLSDVITMRQFMVLLAISHLEEEGASYNAIANKLGTTKQNVKQLIGALEKKKLVNVILDESDHRAVRVQITEAGKAAEWEWGRLGNEFLLKIAENFSCEEIEQMWRLLQKLYAFDSETMDGFEKEIGVGK